MQVSRSKKWESKPALDKNGDPILKKNGKPQLVQSYSLLQDQFYEAMRAAGYDDIERGQRGSTEQHLTVTQFKVQAEKERLQEIIMEQEAVEMQIDALADEKADIERQTQEALDKLNDILPDIEQTEQLAKDFTADPEEILPPPKRMESVKNYRERIKPIWEMIVGVLRSIFNSYLKLKREVQQLRSEVWHLREKNQDLNHENDQLYQENQNLHRTARDFDRAKKILGKDIVENAVATAKEQETPARRQKGHQHDYAR